MHQDPPAFELPDSSEEGSESLLSEFESLIQRGREILLACGWDGKSYKAFRPGGIEVLKFRAQTLGLIRRIFEEESEYYRLLMKYAADLHTARRGFHVKEFLDVLESAYHDHLRSRLFDAPAELLDKLGDDLVELAEAMSNAGCHAPAAERAGRVLEGTLSRLSDARGVGGDEDANPDALNDALLAARIYDQATHRRVGACLQIARDLAGAERDRIPEGELAEMVCWVGDFSLQFRQVASGPQRTNR